MRANVIAQGLATALGATRAVTLDNVASNALAMRRLRGFLGSDFKPQLAAFADGLDTNCTLDRIAILAERALEDLVAQLAGLDLAIERTGVRVAVCLPAPNAVEGLDQMALRHCGEALAVRVAYHTALPVEATSLFLSNGSGMAEAVADQMQDTARGTSLIVVCADSFCCRTRLRGLGDAGHLFGKTTQYGLVPGEAASAILMRMSAHSHGSFAITGAGVAHDPVGEADAGDSDYAAMTNACVAAIGDSGPIQHWISDWNNSRYRAAEMSYAQLRLTAQLERPLQVVHPVLRLGDVGAAGPAVALSLAANLEGESLITSSGGRGGHYKGALAVNRF